jgi:hypothetical protein
MNINYSFEYPPKTSKTLARKRAIAARNKAMIILYKAGIASSEMLTRDINHG